MKNRQRILFTTLLVCLGCLCLAWFVVRPHDPLFHGKPESYWIGHLVYHDETQVEEWRKFGSDGTRVLVRALEGANRPMDRLYRNAYQKMWRILPRVLMVHLPGPREDLTRVTRMKVVDLLASLNKEAKLATPVMARTLNDEDDSVRGCAINFFIRDDGGYALLSQMDAAAKRNLLPAFVRAMQASSQAARANAAIALKYYPEQAEVVVPVLTNALQDPAPLVRRLAADTLKSIDLAAAEKAGLR